MGIREYTRVYASIHGCGGKNEFLKVAAIECYVCLGNIHLVRTHEEGRPVHPPPVGVSSACSSTASPMRPAVLEREYSWAEPRRPRPTIFSAKQQYCIADAIQLHWTESTICADGNVRPKLYSTPVQCHSDAPGAGLSLSC